MHPSWTCELILLLNPNGIVTVARLCYGRNIIPRDSSHQRGIVRVGYICWLMHVLSGSLPSPSRDGLGDGRNVCPRAGSGCARDIPPDTWTAVPGCRGAFWKGASP